MWQLQCDELIFFDILFLDIGVCGANGLFNFVLGVCFTMVFNFCNIDDLG